MILSLRQQLSQISEPKANTSIPAIPSGFHKVPSSLKTAMRAMNSPQVETWEKTSEEDFYNHNWTEECQGVTNDGEYWYISSNNAGNRGIYKFTTQMKELSYFSVEGLGSNHIGDIDYRQGFIYAALENSNQILKLNTDFQSYSLHPLQGAWVGSPPPQRKLPWCAMNPWNGYLYSSDFDDVTQIHAYDPNDNFVYKSSLNLQVLISGVQGGCFSDNGHLLLASNASYDIRCYSVLNGFYLGSAPIQINTSNGEEVEGLTIWKNVALDGSPAQVHLILLDNDPLSQDDVYFKHYTVPSPLDL